MEKLRLWRDDWRVFFKKTDPKTDRRIAPKMTYVIHVYHGRFPGTFVETERTQVWGNARDSRGEPINSVFGGADSGFGD